MDNKQLITTKKASECQTEEEIYKLYEERQRINNIIDESGKVLFAKKTDKEGKEEYSFVNITGLNKMIDGLDAKNGMDYYTKDNNAVLTVMVHGSNYTENDIPKTEEIEIDILLIELDEMRGMLDAMSGKDIDTQKDEINQYLKERYEDIRETYENNHNPHGQIMLDVKTCNFSVDEHIKKAKEEQQKKKDKKSRSKRRGKKYRREDREE